MTLLQQQRQSGSQLQAKNVKATHQLPPKSVVPTVISKKPSPVATINPLHESYKYVLSILYFLFILCLPSLYLSIAFVYRLNTLNRQCQEVAAELVRQGAWYRASSPCVTQTYPFQLLKHFSRFEILCCLCFC